MKIAIIGSGWSGLSCAYKLKELNPQNEITVFESAQHAGGRAKGISWKLSDREILFIDNGQHFIIGAYKNTLELLKKTGSPVWSENTFTWNFSKVDESKKSCERFDLDLSNFFLKKNKWPKIWFLFLALSVVIAKLKFINDSGSARAWLLKSFQPMQLQEVFWRPFIESTTNTDWNEASAKSVIKILDECSVNFPKSIKIFHPIENLSRNGLDYIVSNLRKNGVIFLFGKTVSNIFLENNYLACVDNKNNIHKKFDKVVLALPTHAAKKIWVKSHFPKTYESKKWELQKTRGINTLWIALPKKFKRKREVFSENYWEIRQLSKFHDNSLFVIIERPFSQNRMILSVVHSAIDFKAETNQEKNLNKIKLAASNYLKWMFDLSLQDCEYKLISEKKATIACSSKLADKEQLWGSIFTGKNNIWRCSDDCTYGFPSTIEAAVISGIDVAKSIMIKANQEHH